MRRSPWLAVRIGALAALCASTAFATEEQTPTDEKVAPSAFNRDEPADGPEYRWGLGEGKSYWVPVGNIVLFDFLLNQFDRNFIDPQEEYKSDWSSIEDNFTGSWVYDSDDFDINQFGHPYQGSIYHGFARSAGHGYWTSLGYTIGGSALWEIAGEVTPPSINDQVTTGIGGTFLGEPLYRMASLILENAHAQPSALREFAASMLAPGFNRYAFGSRFDGIFPSGDPAVHTRANLGANINSNIESNVNTNPDPNTPEIPQSYQSGAAVLDFTMVYGLPGKPGYTYDRPFDYFHFQLTATPDHLLENLITRGLLAGSTFGEGNASYRGIWGIYGSYDYIAPQIFRVSNTALNLGTTGQWWMTENVALQNEVIAGVGYGSGGVTESQGLRDYHYGITPQALVGLRFIFADVAALEFTARDYYITDKGSDAEPGHENLARGDVSLTVRVHDLHGITLRYVVSDRNADYETRPDTEQRVAAISVGYTYLGHKWFGAVDWRPRPDLRTEEKLEDAKDAVKEGAKDAVEGAKEVIEETKEIVK